MSSSLATSSQSQDLALTVHQAQKSYKDVQALKGIDLTVKKGEFFGLLGPNGAGKTTLIQAIVGLVRLNAGSIFVFGHDVVKDYMAARRLVGYSPQEVNLDRFFSIGKILEYQAGFFGLPRKEQKKVASRLLEQFNLTSKAKVQYYKLSGGMQKRVLVAKALVSTPQLLILDEPTAGVDVEQRHDLWKYLRELNAKGTTIILTTHYIDEAEALCNRIGIINLGEIKEIGSPKDLILKYCRPSVRLITHQELIPDIFNGIPNVHLEFNSHAVIATGDRPGLMIEKLLGVLLRHENYTVKDIEVNYGSLEDVFLQVAGNRIAAENADTKSL